MIGYERFFKGKTKISSATGLALLVAFIATPLTCGFALQPKVMPDLAVTLVTAAPATGQRDHGNAGVKKHASDAEAPSAKSDKNAYDYNLPGADGQGIPLASFKGKYILIVNLGRKSTYNDQLPALIKFNETYKDKGFVVIGVPSDNFGNGEPGTNPEIQKAYADAKADFPIVSVSSLRGEEELPLYLYLTEGSGAPPGGPVHWNYTKFIIDRSGKVIARFDPDVAPDSPEMLSAVNQILAGSYKPKLAGGEHKKAANTAAVEEDDDDE